MPPSPPARLPRRPHCHARCSVAAIALCAALALSGCGGGGHDHSTHDHAHDQPGKPTAAASSSGTHAHAHGHGHSHVAPNGGTSVVLGEEAYHVELVRDAAAGRLSAYLLDGELEKYIRAAMPGFEILAQVGGETRKLEFMPVANPATGETLTDTALYEATAPWLRETAHFDGVITTITLRGTTFNQVRFNFPRGNEAK